MKNWGFTKREKGDYIIMEPPEIGIHVALVHKTSRSDEEIKANAKLIAAAPELLAACKLALTYIDYNIQFGCGGGNEGKYASQIKSAIKKATK